MLILAAALPESAMLTAPTLISNGEKSAAFFHAVTARLALCVPHNTHVSFDASHGVPLEARAAYDEAVLRFVASAR